MNNKLKDIYYSIVPKTDYLTFSLGYRNVILTAPHGGGIRPLHIPKRKKGKSVRDTYTRTLVKGLAEYFEKDLKPFSLVSDIHRSRVDLNRDIIEGAQGNRRAELIWNSWNDILNRTTKYLLRKYGKVLYVDIHSHNNSDEFQLGYNLSANNYLKLMRNKKAKSPTTLDSISDNKYELLFGKYSFKNTLESVGYKVFTPEKGDVYFNGGRNVEVYSGNGIGSIQVECPVSILKYDLDGVISSLNLAIERFYYGFGI